jgi:secretion/DNA translocation related TadE-like protein
VNPTGERGSVTIVAAAVLTVLLVLGLGAADFARVLAGVGRARTAADAAALAAAQELALPRSTPPAELAAEYANRNGAALQACSCDEGAFEASVRVWVPVGPLLLFGDDHVVERTARAEVVIPSASPPPPRDGTAGP